MMRPPTPARQLYRWWNDALAGMAPPIHDGMPECGFYKTRIVKGGPWAATEIKIVRDVDLDTGELTAPERFIAICDGERRSAARLWTYLTPISREEHRALREGSGRSYDMNAKINLMKGAVGPNG
jgi:hypothetical protein